MCTITLEYDQNNALARRKFALFGVGFYSFKYARCLPIPQKRKRSK